MKFFTLLLFFVAMGMTANAADKKISDLTSLPAASWATGDLIPIVDISAVTTKKTTIGDFDFRYVVNPMTNNGDIITQAAGVPAAIAIGGANTVLTSSGTAASWATIVNANIDAGAAIVDSKLATISSGGKVSNSATTATSANTNSAIVARDGSGNFSAGTITATLSGNVTGTVTGNASNISGIAAIANGGTGQTSQTTGFDALSPLTTAGDSLTYGSGHNVRVGTVIGDLGKSWHSGGGSVSNSWAFTTLTTDVSGLLPVANGGTGIGTLSANNVLLGNGTSALQVVAPGTSGNVLTSNGTTWASSAATGGGSGVGARAFVTNPDAETNTTGWIAYTDTQTATMTLASPAVVTITSTTNMYVGMPFTFTNSGGALPTGITAGNTYYISAVLGGGTTFNFSSTLGGANVNTSGSQSGTHTFHPFVPVAANAGSPTTTWTRSTSTPLTGTASFLYTKTAADLAGEGASYAFSISAADEAKVLKIDMDYIVASGTFVAGTSSTDSDLEIWILDVTNGKIIQPSSYKLTSNSTGVASHFSAYFQSASNSTSYILAIHDATNSASAFTLEFDSVNVSTSQYIYGTPITDWTAFVPTGVWTTNATYSGYWRRVGGNLEERVKVALTGAPTGTETVNIPSVCAIDTTRLEDNTGATVLGAGVTKSAGSFSDVVITYNSTTSVSPIVKNAASTILAAATAITATVPATYANADNIEFHATFPCVGWGASVQMSTDNDQRVVSFSAYLTSNQTGVNPNASAVKFAPTAINYDTHGGFDTVTNHRYTVPVSGYYNFSATLAVGGTNALANNYQVLLYKNGSQLQVLGQTWATVSSPVGLTGSATVSAVAGDYFEIFIFGAGNNSASTLTINGAATTGSTFSGQKVSGPTAIGATETIAGRWTNVAGTSIANSGDVAMVFATTDYDTHGCFDGTSTCTIKAPGKYRIHCQDVFASSLYAAGNDVATSIYKNGSAVGYGPVVLIGGTPTGIVGSEITQTLALVTGDQIVCRVTNPRTAGATSLSTTAGENEFDISRVGL